MKMNGEMAGDMSGDMAGHRSGDMQMRDGPVLVGEESRAWALAGFLIGAILGVTLGAALGQGVISVRVLAPISASSAVVPAFVAACVLGAAGALIGGLLGTRAEANNAGRAGQSEKPAMSPGKMRMSGASGSGNGWISHLPIDGTIVLIILMALTLYVIASTAIGRGAPSDQANRLHWQLKNATRIGGVDDRTTELAVLETAYPGTRPENSASSVFVAPNDWRSALAATPLIATPTSAAVVVADAGGLVSARLAQLGAAGVIGANAAPGAAATSAATPAGAGPDATAAAASLADSVDGVVTGATGSQTRNLLVVAGDAPAQWSLPAAAYAARTGTPIVFVTAAGIPPASARMLERRRGAALMYILGPQTVIAEHTEQALRRYGRVTRIAGRTPARNAISFAEYQDSATDFGWGHTGRGPRSFANMNSILVSDDRWQDAIAAAHLARSTGKSGPLLFTHGTRLTAEVESYFWRVRPAFANTPAEGPYSNVWVVGSFARIPYGAQARADYAQEIEQYMTLGDSALSGLEGLALAWIAFAVASAIWIAYHAQRRVAGMMPMMRAAWVLFALMLGPIALWWYVAGYDRRPMMPMKEPPEDGAGGEKKGSAPAMMMWQRPLWARVVSATVMMFAFDMMLMVLAVFVLAYRGFPIVQGTGPLYWTGTAMFLMMVFMYVAALILMLLVFHTPMTMHERGITSYWRALAVGAPIMIATMTVESVGMMPTMWWAQMSFLPSMQMPTDDDLTMWTTLLMAVGVALLVVLPFNYALVKRGMKKGTM